MVPYAPWGVASPRALGSDSVKPASAKQKGSRLERDFGNSAGGRRNPGSGAFGGGDIRFGDDDPIWSGVSWEAKARAKLPHLITAAMLQARTDIAVGDTRIPGVVLREDGGQILVVFDWIELRRFVGAIAEVGNQATLKAHVRQIERDLAALKGAIR